MGRPCECKLNAAAAGLRHSRGPWFVKLGFAAGIGIGGRVREGLRVTRRRAVLIALALLLLLLQQFVEANFLLRIEDGAKLFFGLLQLLTDFGLKRLHEFLRALLAGGDDFVDLLPLVGRQVQVAFDAAQELDSDAASRDWLDSAVSLPMLGARRRLNGVLHQQAAGHHASAENDDCRENDLPGVHQMESDACWLAAARTVFSKSCERSPCAGVGEAKKVHAPRRRT